MDARTIACPTLAVIAIVAIVMAWRYWNWIGYWRHRAHEAEDKLKRSEEALRGLLVERLTGKERR